MSRTIRFRAWDGQKMHDSPPMHDEWGSLNHAIDDCIRHGQTLMQSTGLKDKNGKEIYEGDVLYYDPTLAERWFHCVYEGNFPVSWSSGSFFISENLPIYKVEGADIEIIGNIYENPELLEPK